LDDGRVFRTPAHPVPILAFLLLVVRMLALFALGRPLRTVLGAAVVSLGLPLSWVVIPVRSRSVA
jgi:hypothetical protein